jgi:hypothetical protein
VALRAGEIELGLCRFEGTLGLRKAGGEGHAALLQVRVIISDLRGLSCAETDGSCR